ncbi:MAG: GNAT family N-acetyltransferase [Polaribacter sp.]|nr:GNAT family N-acetyltransferase [Polaribacter sp.]
MIPVSKDIQLKAVTIQDCTQLYKLMQMIYPPAYHHFWTDKGAWYVDGLYNKENIHNELKETSTGYYFVLFKKEVVGILRVLWDAINEHLAYKKSAKLHRIYLHQKAQGNSIGKNLLTWVEHTAREKGCETLWLEAMDTQEQAFEFYKKAGYVPFNRFDLDFPLLIDKHRGLTQVYKEL